MDIEIEENNDSEDDLLSQEDLEYQLNQQCKVLRESLIMKFDDEEN